ncbi:unnamed protein product, partial [Protopolystoma xenopodis]
MPLSPFPYLLRSVVKRNSHTFCSISSQIHLTTAAKFNEISFPLLHLLIKFQICSQVNQPVVLLAFPNAVPVGLDSDWLRLLHNMVTTHRARRPSSLQQTEPLEHTEHRHGVVSLLRRPAAQCLERPDRSV